MADSRSMAATGGGVLPIIGAFVAGFVAVLVFHQAAIWLLQVAGLPVAPYNMTPTRPLGVPVVFSLAFWGGVWGIVLAFLLRGRRPGVGYWVIAIVLGGALTTLVAWFVVPMFKGLTVGLPPLNRIVIGPVVNAAWGFGTGLLLLFLPAGWRWR